MNEIKLIASDMDGTLLTTEKQISAENLQAIENLRAKNIIFAIASGRNYPELQEYLARFSFLIPAMALNGGLIYDENQRIIFDQPFDLDTLSKLVSLLTELNVYFEVLDDKYFYSNSEENRIILIKKLLEASNCSSVVAVEDDRYTRTVFHEYNDELLRSHQFYKLRIFDLHNADLKWVAKKVQEEIACEITLSASSNIEINPVGVNKGNGILQLCRHYNIKQEDVLAVGDNINDIPMIEVAGHFCAMANSHAEVLRLTDFVTDTNDNNGIAKMINKIIN